MDNGNNEKNPYLKDYSKKLRREMTKEEKHLWYDFFKKLPFTVNRQKVIGEYIVDFYCASARLVIEIDGSQHYTEEGEAKDLERDTDLKEHGYYVVRYTNIQINSNFKGVCKDILLHMGIVESEL